MKKRDKEKLKQKGRKPLLVDHMLANSFDPPQIWPIRTQQAMRDKLRESKKFVFNDDATRYAAQMIRDYPVAIAKDQEFAIPPFENMYIEYPTEPLFSVLNATTSVDKKLGDARVGYHICGPEVYVMSQGYSREHMKDWTGSDKARCMPIVYRLNKPFTVNEELQVCDDLSISRLGIDLLYWGSVYDRVKGEGFERDLRLNHSFKWIFEGSIQRHFAGHPDREQYLGQLIQAAAGDLRNILGMLLFLNRTRDVRIEDHVGNHHAMVGLKSSVLMKHNVVKIRLDPRPMLMRVYGTGSPWRRRHEVRGHFCHDKKARAAGHHVAATPGSEQHPPEWVESGVNQWFCRVCGGKRWHRAEHKRGHEEKGTVVKTYEVSK